MERLFKPDRRAIKRLARETARIGEGDEVRHAPKLRLLFSAGRDLNADRAQALGDLAQSPSISDFPAGVRDIVRFIAMEREAVCILVHAQQQPSVVDASCALQSKDLRGEVLPALEVLYPQSEIATASC